jgi:hypothetical protein
MEHMISKNYQQISNKPSMTKQIEKKSSNLSISKTPADPKIQCPLHKLAIKLYLQ